MALTIEAEEWSLGYIQGEIRTDESKLWHWVNGDENRKGSSEATKLNPKAR